MVAPGALSAEGGWLSADASPHVTDSAAWIASGAIISLDVAAIARLFSGVIELVACVASLYAVPMIALVWLIAARRGS